MLKWEDTPERCVALDFTDYSYYEIVKIKGKWSAHFVVRNYCRLNLGENLGTEIETKADCETHAAVELRKHMEWARVRDWKAVILSNHRRLNILIISETWERTVYIEFMLYKYFQVCYRDRMRKLKRLPRTKNFDEALAAALALVG